MVADAGLLKETLLTRWLTFTRASFAMPPRTVRPSSPETEPAQQSDAGSKRQKLSHTSDDPALARSSHVRDGAYPAQSHPLCPLFDPDQRESISARINGVVDGAERERQSGPPRNNYKHEKEMESCGYRSPSKTGLTVESQI